MQCILFCSFGEHQEADMFSDGQGDHAVEKKRRKVDVRL